MVVVAVLLLLVVVVVVVPVVVAVLLLSFLQPAGTISGTPRDAWGAQKARGARGATPGVAAAAELTADESANRWICACMRATKHQ